MSNILLIIICFLLTSIIELITLILLKVNDNKIYIVSIIINLFTNVTINILFGFVIDYTFINIIISEFIIFLIESFIYYLINRNFRLAFWYSFFCNLFSFIAGYIIFNFIKF